MKTNWVRNIIGGISFTTALFVFQACYGTPKDFMPDMLIEGQVKSKTSGLPIKGIKVIVTDNNQYEFTDETGKFSLYTVFHEGIKLQFRDIDSIQNGLYTNKDTVLTQTSEKVYLDIQLEEKR